MNKTSTSRTNNFITLKTKKKKNLVFFRTNVYPNACRITYEPTVVSPLAWFTSGVIVLLFCCYFHYYFIIIFWFNFHVFDIIILNWILIPNDDNLRIIKKNVFLWMWYTEIQLNSNKKKVFTQYIRHWLVFIFKFPTGKAHIKRISRIFS